MQLPKRLPYGGTKMEIKKTMAIKEVLDKYPEAAQVLFEGGIHCVGCHMAAEETLEQGLKAHNLNDKQVDEVIKKMNELIKKEKKPSNEK